MEFTIDHKLLEINQNRSASRHDSTEKHDALNVMLDNLLYLGVIQPSNTTAWSHVHLVIKNKEIGDLPLTTDP